MTTMTPEQLERYAIGLDERLREVEARMQWLESLIRTYGRPEL